MNKLLKVIRGTIITFCFLFFAISIPFIQEVLAFQNNEINGDISEDCTLIKENSPYFVTGNVEVLEGATLTIEDGVEVQFVGNYSIYVAGTIYAKGTEENHIKFKSMKKEKWDKLILNSNNNVLEFIDIDNANKALEIYKDENRVSNINITNCNVNLSLDRQKLNYIARSINNSLPDKDINKDKKIDIRDVSALATVFNIKAGHSGYDNKKDLNKDSIIDVYDLVAVTKHIGAEDSKLFGKTIVLDPGHGGKDPGAVKDVYVEKYVNLSLAQKLREELLKLGANVIMTRTTDIYLTLQERVDVANSVDADLFLSIHYDSSYGSTAKGVSTHYSSYRPAIETKDVYITYDNDTSKIRYPFISEKDGKITFNYNGTTKSSTINYVTPHDPTPSYEAYQSGELSQLIVDNMAKLGLYNRGKRDHNLYVTRWAKMPSVLIEAGFISNLEEAKKVTAPEMQTKLAQKISDSVLEFFLN